jgi:hypothetical protein
MAASQQFWPAPPSPSAPIYADAENPSVLSSALTRPACIGAAQASVSIPERHSHPIVLQSAVEFLEFREEIWVIKILSADIVGERLVPVKDRVSIEIGHFLSQDHLVVQKKCHVFERVEEVLAPTCIWLSVRGLELSSIFGIKTLNVSKNAIENLELNRSA